MRTTIRLDDDLFIELKEQARRENISLGELLNRTLRAGIKASHQQKTQKLCYREKTVSNRYYRAVGKLGKQR